MIISQTSLRIRYAETDQMKTAYYGRYFEYFEQGRSDLLRNIGMPYSQVEEMGLLLPVIEAHAVYKKPARYDDEIQVVTYLREKPVARVRIDYEVLRTGDPDPIAEGYTIHTFVNATTGKPTRAPGQFLEVIERAMAKNER